MQEGDTVQVLAETSDRDAIGVLRGKANIDIGRRMYEYLIVRFADGHEGAYEERELRVIEPPKGR
jgi:hypothetical protein